MRDRAFALSVLCLSLLWGSEGVSLGQTPPGGGAREEIVRFSRFYPLLNRRVTFDARTRPREIIVWVDNLRLDDVLVIRGQGEVLSIWAGYASGRLGDLLQRGVLDVHPLPSSCVRVEGTTVSVRRPEEIEGIVFVDLQVPRDTRVHLVRDGQTLLRARVSEPIALREGALAPGSRNPAETVLRAVFGGNAPDVLRPPSPDQPYTVSFHRLTIRKRMPVSVPRGERLVVLFVINADGTVAQVVPLEPETIAPEVERALQQWEFEPFVYEGRAVSVKTLALIR